MTRDYRLGLIAGLALAVAIVGALFATGTCEIVSSDPAVTPTVTIVTPTVTTRPTVAPTLPVAAVATPTPTPTPLPMRPAPLGDGGLR